MWTLFVGREISGCSGSEFDQTDESAQDSTFKMDDFSISGSMDDSAPEFDSAPLIAAEGTGQSAPGIHELPDSSGHIPKAPKLKSLNLYFLE